MPKSLWNSARALATAAICTGMGAAQAQESTEVDRATLWMGNVTQTRIEHESQVVELALEKSRDRYGDYVLTLDPSPYSQSRAFRSLSEGESINIVSAPALTYYQPGQQRPLITIDVPLLRGLLSERLAIVRHQDAAAFSRIDSLEELSQLSAGMGFDWSDRFFFQHNGLELVTGNNLEQLFTMLAHGRFDYLPLGRLEAAKSLARSGHQDTLTIAPEPVIQYPNPIYLQVSATRPELAERLRYGLEVARRDGSLDALFQRHYGDIVERRASDAHTIKLALPNALQGEL